MKRVEQILDDPIREDNPNSGIIALEVFLLTPHLTYINMNECLSHFLQHKFLAGTFAFCFVPLLSVGFLCTQATFYALPLY